MASASAFLLLEWNYWRVVDETWRDTDDDDDGDDCLQLKKKLQIVKKLKTLKAKKNWISIFFIFWN